ncbi:MAG TPA: hemerythrin domain-containing protein [Phycisphaerae bacterium]|jgi:hemerythrin-like domain-containing protein
MPSEDVTTRRVFLGAAAAAGGGMILSGARADQPEGKSPAEGKEQHEEEVSPAEDLMREHGLLNRVLLVFDEYVRRIDGKGELPPEPLADAAGIIRRFVEDYHEKLEEDYLFPRFEKAKLLTDLVQVLRAQHQAGRGVTDQIRQRATAAALKDADERPKLSASLRAFVRMYRPHEAREDTVLFPALRRIITASEYDALGEDFEKKEHALFGEEGFEKMVAEVEKIERALGIFELSQFTPRA